MMTVYTEQAAMPRSAVTLTDVRSPTIEILCEPCQRRGRYNVEMLIAKHVDMRLPDLKMILANCEKARSFSVYDRCKAKYEGLEQNGRRVVHVSDEGGPQWTGTALREIGSK